MSLCRLYEHEADRLVQVAQTSAKVWGDQIGIAVTVNAVHQSDQYLGAFQDNMWEPELSTLMGAPLNGNHEALYLYCMHLINVEVTNLMVFLTCREAAALHQRTLYHPFSNSHRLQTQVHRTDRGRTRHAGFQNLRAEQGGGHQPMA